MIGFPTWHSISSQVQGTRLCGATNVGLSMLGNFDESIVVILALSRFLAFPSAHIFPSDSSIQTLSYLPNR